jgi:hypothetical protein
MRTGYLSAALEAAKKGANWTAIATLAAAIAAIAGTIQAYVSWRGRDDVLRATIITTMVQACSEAMGEGATYTLLLQSSNDAEELAAERARFTQKATSILALGRLMEEGDEYKEFVKRGGQLQDKLREIEAKSRVNLTKADRDTATDALYHLIEEINVQCKNIIKGAAHL